MTSSAGFAPSTVQSVADILGAFPALRRPHGNTTVGYFDAPGGTQVPERVADAVTDQLLRHNANAHWAYESSRELDRVLALV